MPIRYVEHIREIRRQYYREFIYKHQLNKILKQLKERLELLNKEIRNLELDIPDYNKADELFTTTINYYKKALIHEKSRLIKNIQEVEIDIT